MRPGRVAVGPEEANDRGWSGGVEVNSIVFASILTRRCEILHGHSAFFSGVGQPIAGEVGRWRFFKGA